MAYRYSDGARGKGEIMVIIPSGIQMALTANAAVAMTTITKSIFIPESITCRLPEEDLLYAL